MEARNEEKCQLSPTKRFKKYENKGKAGLYESSLNIIEKHLAVEENELSANLETIEERILTLQQLLHSVKYYASLNLYAYDRVHRENNEVYNRKNSLNHPTIQRLIGKSDVSFPNSQNNLNEKDITSSSSIPHEQSQIQIEIDKVDKNGRLIPEREPIVIGQRRREPFQKKVGFYLGNTYRYINDSESCNPMKFQWRVIIRTQDKKNPIENFISFVKYTLHESYAPNNVVIVKKPPFILTHKGWGEFQVKVELNFVDERNKPINMIHTLKLARNDDSLSYSGLWRLGSENLFEIWIFDKAKDLEIEEGKKRAEQSHKSEISEEYMKAELQSSLGTYSEISYKDNDGNLTFSHTPKRCESSVEEYSTENVEKEEWNDIHDKYSSLISKTICGIDGIDILTDREATNSSFLGISYNEEDSSGGNAKLMYSNKIVKENSSNENSLQKPNNEITKVKSVDLQLDTIKALFAGSTRVNLKTVSLKNVKNLRKDLKAKHTNSEATYSASVKNSYSVKPNILKAKYLALSTNKNEENGKNSSIPKSSLKNISLSNELGGENLSTHTNLSPLSTPQNQIILTCGKKITLKKNEELISTIPHSFKIFNTSTKKFNVAATPMKNPNSSTDNELNYVKNLQDKKLEIRRLCVKCSSVEEVLPVYWKNLQSFLTLAKNFGPSSADSQTFCARSCERSVEFWLAREIGKELRILSLKDREGWSTANIVSWARKHLFICQKTDISYLFELEKRLSPKDTIDTISTLNVAPCTDNDRGNENVGVSNEIESHTFFNDYVNVDVDEIENNQYAEESHDDRKALMFTPDYMIEPIQFIDSVLSRIRNHFRPEEIIEGVNMDIAKYILYKATLCLMEDLLRRSFSVAAAEAYHKRSAENPLEDKLLTVNEKHIFTALSKHRQSFQTLTQHGLGKKFVGPSSDHISLKK